MDKEKSEGYNIELDTNLRNSGVQGGKIMGEHLALGSFVFGIPLLIIGLWSLFNYVLFGSGFPIDYTAILVSPPILAIVTGLLLIIGGYSIHRFKHVKD